MCSGWLSDLVNDMISLFPITMYKEKNRIAVDICSLEKRMDGLMCIKLTLTLPGKKTTISL